MVSDPSSPWDSCCLFSVSFSVLRTWLGTGRGTANMVNGAVLSCGVGFQDDRNWLFLLQVCSGEGVCPCHKS